MRYEQVGVVGRYAVIGCGKPQAGQGDLGYKGNGREILSAGRMFDLTGTEMVAGAST